MAVQTVNVVVSQRSICQDGLHTKCLISQSYFLLVIIKDVHCLCNIP